MAKLKRSKGKAAVIKMGSAKTLNGGNVSTERSGKTAKNNLNHVAKRDILKKKKKGIGVGKTLKYKEQKAFVKDITAPAPVRKGDDELHIPRARWMNKQRALVFCSRGVSFRDRHLMQDIRTLLPHSKPDSKMDKRESLPAINEICEMKNCNKCIYLEARKKKDLYMWVSNVSRGPCAKFLVENVHTMLELRLTGNCLRGSRALLSFDEAFDLHPHWKLLKELFTQIFSTPLYHPKSQPFFDHVFNFTILDNRIWFRNYQIVEEDGSLAEIGPRFVLNPIRIFSGSFGGETLYDNPHYVSPNLHRRMVRLARSGKYIERVQSRKGQEERNKTLTQVFPHDKTDEIFDNVD